MAPSPTLSAKMRRPLSAEWTRSSSVYSELSVQGNHNQHHQNNNAQAGPSSFGSTGGGGLFRPPNVKRRSTGTVSSVGDGLGYYFSNSAGLGPASSSSASSISLASSTSGASFAAGVSPGGAGMAMVHSHSQGVSGSGVGRGLAKSQSHTNLKEILQDAQDETPRMSDKPQVEGALPLPRVPKGSRPQIQTHPSDSSSSYSDEQDSGTDPGPSARPIAGLADPKAVTVPSPYGAFDSPSSLPSQYSASSTSPHPHYFSHTAPPLQPPRPAAMLRSGTDGGVSNASEDSPGLSEFRHLYTGNEAVQRDLATDFADSMDLSEAEPTSHPKKQDGAKGVRESVASVVTERPGSMSYDKLQQQQTTPRVDGDTSRLESSVQAAQQTQLQSRRGTDASSLLSVDIERRDSKGPPSPSRSPAPPPRSALRGTPGLELPSVSSPLTISPRTSSIELPREPSSSRSTPLPPSSSPLAEQSRPRTHTVAGTVPIPRPASSAPAGTIGELTAMLGGAIDEIGLIDSRDTPPPTVLEPHSREKPAHLSLPVQSKAVQPGPLTPGAVPPRANSLSAAQAASMYTPQDSTPPEQKPIPLQRMQSTASFATDATTPSARPWPQAMVSSQIKKLRTPGERAMAYAKAISDIARADSGLCGWCAATASRSRMPNDPSRSTKLGYASSLSRSDVYSLSGASTSQRARNVSSSSEFPMREDSYIAREISARELDPSDRPTALPPNLPYPQLQQPARLAHASMAPSSYNGVMGATLRPSQSMQSVASVSTVSTGAERRKGFFAGLKKGKKDSISLGPPNPTMMPPPTAGANTKKDVRNLQISAPSYGESAARASSGLAGAAGPKGPRGSYTPPPPFGADMSRLSIDSGSLGSRASFDSSGGGGGGAAAGAGMLGYARHAQARGSLESVRTTRSSAPGLHGSSPLVSSGPIDYSMPSRGSPLATSGGVVGGGRVPSEQDVSAMADILPHVQKNVLRAYLGKYGEQMVAIGAYLEDEQRGTVMR